MDLRRKHRPILITYGAFLLLWLGIGLVVRISSMNVVESGHSDRLLPAGTAADGAAAIELGVFVDNIYLLDTESRSFDSNGWIWLRWPDAVQQKLAEKQLSPDKLIVFGNEIDNWDFALEPADEGVVREADGRYYQRFHYSGHFYVEHLDLHRYPFQTIGIPLIFELADSLPSLLNLPLTLEIDREQSGIGSYIDITGYETQGYRLTSHIHEYASTMGNPLAKGDRLRVPQARIVVSYKKSFNATFMSLLLPLITVMTLTLFSPSLSSSAWDVRVGIPPTALLTLIFLQQGYRDKLPELPYVSFLDTLYNACYVVNIVLFGLFLWSSNEIHEATEADRSEVVARIERIDRRFQIGLTVFLLLAVAANWWVISVRHG